LAAARFDPFTIEPFSVIRLPYRFEGGHLLEKMFVVLGHRRDGLGEAYAICLKATSQIAVYQNNPGKMRGCVYYAAGQTTCFAVDTVVQPDNQIPIKHSALADAHFDGGLTRGTLPTEFAAQLRTAIANSITMSKAQKARLLELLDCPID